MCLRVCRTDLQRVQLKGTLSDRALAAALYFADKPGLPGQPTASDSQNSGKLFHLLQAVGEQQDFACRVLPIYAPLAASLPHY